MQRRFVIKGFIACFRKIKNGYRIAIGEPALNKLAQKTYQWVTIWGAKAQAIQPKLRLGLEVVLKGSIEIVAKNGKTYVNHHVDQWLILKSSPRQIWTPKEQDDDYFVPEPRNNDSRQHRLAEGFQGHLR